MLNRRTADSQQMDRMSLKALKPSVMATVQFCTAISTQNKDLKAFLCEDVEISVAELKKGKSTGVDYIPA